MVIQIMCSHGGDCEIKIDELIAPKSAIMIPTEALIRYNFGIDFGSSAIAE